MSLAAQIVIALILLVAGFGGGVKYHAGVIAQRDASGSGVPTHQYGSVLKGLAWPVNTV